MSDKGQGDGPIGGGPLNPTPPDGPPLNEDILEQARDGLDESRVVELEAIVAGLENTVADLERRLADALGDAAGARRAHAVERELGARNAIDIETCSLLIDAAIAGTPDPDIPGAVRELRRQKPFLFALEPTPHASSVMAPAPTPGENTLASLACKARAGGDRTALLRYLRTRRTV